MTRITRQLWIPDTCDCQIYTLFDADLPPEEQVQTPIEVEPNTIPTHPDGTLRCEAHSKPIDANSNPVEHYNIVLEENQRKNIEHGKIGSDKVITWKFTGESPNRVLHVFHNGKKVSEVSKKK